MQRAASLWHERHRSNSSDFEKDHTGVRYYVKANIVRDWKWDHKVKQHFMVNGILDLNLYPSAQAPGECDLVTSICWCNLIT